MVLRALGVRAVCCEYGGAMSHAALMARELGLTLELDQIHVHPLVHADLLREDDLERFFAGLADYDQTFAASLAATLMVAIVVFQAGDGSYGAVPADEIDGDEVVIVSEYDPFG